MKTYMVLVSGVRFEWLLCDVFARDVKGAKKEARKHVETGEVWRVVEKKGV